MIQKLPDPDSARNWCQSQRWDGRTIGYVPTMGALHDGHLSLVQRAIDENDVCCVSIFVNPLQFNDPDDLKRYPNDLRRDIRLLDEAGCDMVYFGDLLEFFPEISDIDNVPLETTGVVGKGLEGDHRPGHLDGVKTIVSRLFHIVGPCRAYFGEKDFQQTLVVKELAAELGYPDIVVCPIAREENGLARSSRNALLSESERAQAGVIYRALTAAKRQWQAGTRDPMNLRQCMLDVLNGSPFTLEYAELRDPENWLAEAPITSLERAQALIAGKLGRVRLIDTLRLDEDEAASEQEVS